MDLLCYLKLCFMPSKKVYSATNQYEGIKHHYWALINYNTKCFSVLTLVMQDSDARNIMKHVKAVTACLCFLSCGYASVTLEMSASIWTNWKKVNLYVTWNNTTSKAQNCRSQKHMLLNHSYMCLPSLPSSVIKLYPWRWPRGPTTCRRGSKINISMISKYMLDYTVKMYYKIVYHMYN